MKKLSSTLGAKKKSDYAGAVATPSKRTIVLKFAVIVVVLVLIAGLGFMVWKNRTPKVVCGEDTVNQYNVAVKAGNDYDAKLKEVAESAESKRGYEKDLTCVFIAYQHYAYVQDVDRSRQLLEIYKKLSAEGKQLPKDVLDVKPVELMEMYVNNLELSRSSGGETDESVR